jgi:hypothetical protein
MATETRQQFVEKWAKYVISNDNWSKLQAELIDAQIENAINMKLTRKQVDFIKGKIKTRKRS